LQGSAVRREERAAAVRRPPAGAAGRRQAAFTFDQRLLRPLTDYRLLDSIRLMESPETFTETLVPLQAVPASGLPAAPDEAARARALDAARKRKARHRRRLLERLWSPRGVQPCGGPSACPWAPPGEPCGCSDHAPCRCERALFEALRTEGSRYFGGVVLGGLSASLLVATARAATTGAPEALKLKLELLKVLLADSRGREDLRQRERRLALEEGSRPRPVSQVMAELMTRQAPATAEGSR
jgi:hypothetical protein